MNFSQRFFINSKLRSISDLQSITANRLIKTRKFQIRWVFNNIRSRNRIASNSIISTNDLRNRSFYHIKYRRFFIVYLFHLFRKYRAFCHTKCQIFHVFNQWSHFANFLLVYSIFQIFRMFVAFATIFSNRTMICIVIYESFISIKHLVEIMKIFASTIASTIAIATSNDWKLNCFFISFVVLLIDFLSHERMYQ